MVRHAFNFTQVVLCKGQNLYPDFLMKQIMNMNFFSCHKPVFNKIVI